jgi:hypothetical protein
MYTHMRVRVVNKILKYKCGFDYALPHPIGAGVIGNPQTDANGSLISK